MAVSAGGSATMLTVKPGGLTRAFRYIEIREVEPGRCTVTNGEIMGGLLVGRLVFIFFGEKVRQGLQGMNEALKRLVEAGA